MTQNYLCLVGNLSTTDTRGQRNDYPIKIIIPQGFPFVAPKVFLNMSLKKSIIDMKSYLGSMNMFKIPYLTSWSNSMG